MSNQRKKPVPTSQAQMLTFPSAVYQEIGASQLMVGQLLSEQCAPAQNHI